MPRKILSFVGGGPTYVQDRVPVALQLLASNTTSAGETVLTAEQVEDARADLPFPSPVRPGKIARLRRRARPSDAARVRRVHLLAQRRSVGGARTREVTRGRQRGRLLGMPIPPVVCDFCGKPIRLLSEGWVQWVSKGKAVKFSEVSLVHGAFGPVEEWRGCTYHERHEDGWVIGDEAATEFPEMPPVVRLPAQAVRKMARIVGGL